MPSTSRTIGDPPNDLDDRPGSLLIVTAYFPPWGGGGVIRMTKLVKYLARMGWQITVVCSDELEPEVVDKTLLAEIPDSVSVHRVRGPFRSIGGRARGAAAGSSQRRVLGAIVSAIKVAIRALLIPDRWLGWALKVRRMPIEAFGDPDVVLSSGPPHSAHLAASAVAKRLGVPHVVDLRDDWGHNPLHRNPAPWHGPIDRMLEQRTLRRAASVVTIFDTSTRSLARRYRWLEKRIVTIPNGFDPEDLVGLEPRVPRKLGEVVRYLYAGSLRGSQEVGKFFEVFGEIAREAPGSLHLTLLGFISSQHEALARASIPGDAIAVLAPVSHRGALEAMAAADVLVLFTGGGGAAGADTMTGKLYEYLALRRPILLIGPDGPASRLVVHHLAGVTATATSAAAIDKAIRNLNSTSMAERFDRTTAIDLEAYSRRALAAAYHQLLASPAGGSVQEVLATSPARPREVLPRDDDTSPHLNA